MWEHLRAPDILWKHCGPKIRRSRDSILSSEANHVIRRRRLAYFYSFCTSLKMKKWIASCDVAAEHLRNIWVLCRFIFDVWVSALCSCVFFIAIKIVWRELDDPSSGCVIFDHFLEIKFVLLYPLKITRVQ